MHAYCCFRFGYQLPSCSYPTNSVLVTSDVTYLAFMVQWTTMTHNLVHQHHVNYRTNHCLHKCAHVGGRKAQQEKLVLQATDSTAYAAHV